MRYLKTLPRRFKNGFREGAYSDERVVHFSFPSGGRGSETLRTRRAFFRARDCERAARARGASRSTRASTVIADGFRSHRDRRPHACARAHYPRRGGLASRAGFLALGRWVVWRGERAMARRVPTLRPSRLDPSPVASGTLARRVPTPTLAHRKSAPLTSPPRSTIRLLYRHGGRLQEARRFRVNGIFARRSRWAHREISLWVHSSSFGRVMEHSPTRVSSLRARCPRRSVSMARGGLDEKTNSLFMVRARVTRLSLRSLHSTTRRSRASTSSPAPG
jgi:hypothetical protein